MLKEKIQIRNTRYYEIINKSVQKALYLSSGADDFQKEKVYLDEPNQKSLGQAWQIFRVDPEGTRRPDCFELVHARSTLVLTNLQQQSAFRSLFEAREANEVRLRFGNWENTQLFYLEQPNSKDFPNVYRFRSYDSTSEASYLTYDKVLKCEVVNPDDEKCHWQIKPCYGNDIINRSCYLENAFSGLTVDVPAGSHKDGCRLIQYSHNNRFNQRFNIYKSGKYFKIGNLNSKLFVTIDKKGIEGRQIQQKDACDRLEQLWSIEYQGKSLFLIRSAQHPHLLMGVKDNCLRKEESLVCTSHERFALWKIIGFIPT